jgi:phosphinothricin acetyltransferase
MHIRPATEADLPAIRDIYNYYVDTSTATFQLEHDTEAERLAWFRKRSEKHPAIVAVEGDDIIGWASLSPHKERAGYARTVEASVYIHHNHLRRGVGRELLRALVDRARELGHRVIIGGACTEHPGSIALQRSMGFESVGVFRAVGRKFGRWLDVEYLQFTIKDT